MAVDVMFRGSIAAVCFASFSDELTGGKHKKNLIAPIHASALRFGIESPICCVVACCARQPRGKKGRLIRDTSYASLIIRSKDQLSRQLSAQRQFDIAPARASNTGRSVIVAHDHPSLSELGRE
jgi:hypothetical protein